jgi:tetratricopeptide (TPR) repeat protein
LWLDGAFKEGIVTTDALYERATDAVERQNYDYAIELLFQIIQQNPRNVKARQTLWLAERRKFEKGASKMDALKGFGSRFLAGIHSLTGKPEKIMEDCERYLTNDPNHVVVRNQLAQAAYDAGDMETAIAAYECSREIDPKNITALRRLGQLYKARFDENHAREYLDLSLARWEELLRVKPIDAEGRQVAQALAAQRAIDDGGWHDTKTFRDVVRDEDKQAELEQKDKIVRTEDDVELEIGRLEELVKAEPNRGQYFVRLGDLYLAKRRFKSAEERFRRAHELDPTNTFTRARLGDVKIRFMEARIEQLQERISVNPGDEAAKKSLAETMVSLHDFMIKDYRIRVDEQPTNMEVHQKLGELLFDKGEFDPAMTMFQKSVADPRYRLIANHMLGRCLVAKGMYDRAINMFKRAVERTVVMNLQTKAVYYDMGETCEKMGNWSEAEQAYGKIYDVDVDYRDITKKMDYIYKKARETT